MKLVYEERKHLHPNYQHLATLTLDDGNVMVMEGCYMEAYASTKEKAIKELKEVVWSCMQRQTRDFNEMMNCLNTQGA